MGFTYLTMKDGEHIVGFNSLNYKHGDFNGIYPTRIGDLTRLHGLIGLWLMAY